MTFITIPQQARHMVVLVVFFFFISVQTASAQYERKFSSFPKYNVSPKAETYDSAILYLANNEYVTKPSYIFKSGLEGKELFRRQFDTRLEINDAVATSDSGFAVSGNMTLYIKNGTDSTYAPLLLKFNKCAALEWGRYMPTADYGLGLNLVSSKNGDIFLCAYGINGTDDNKQKPISVIRFNKSGTLMGHASFEGIDAKLYYDKFRDQLYLSQDVYLPLVEGGTTAYAFNGIKQISTKLATTAETVIGFKSKQITVSGTLVVEQNRFISLANASVSTPNSFCSIFSSWDNSLKISGSSVFDCDAKYEVEPGFACGFGDSLAVVNLIETPQNGFDSFYLSIRLYDTSFHVLKEQIYNKNWKQTSTMLLPLQDKNRFVLGVMDLNPNLGPIGSSVFLYDRFINQQAWPAALPVKGYDWGCTGTIIQSEKIVFDTTLIKPVSIVADTSRPDWKWLYASVYTPTMPNAERAEQWLSWPNPLENGEQLYFRNLERGNFPNSNRLRVLFHDLYGREAGTSDAVFESTGEWYVRSVQLPHSGFFIASVFDSLGNLIATISILVK